jgi:hypothetical protein
MCRQGSSRTVEPWSSRSSHDTGRPSGVSKLVFISPTRVHYGLDDRAIGVRSPTGVKDFSPILCVQTGSGSNPASCPMGTGGTFPGVKARPGRDADHSLHLVPRS